MINNGKILFQFPTKDRVCKFFETLDKYYELLANIDMCIFHVVISEDDNSMNNSTTLLKLKGYKNLTYSVTDQADTKIKACNYGIDKFSDWDILCLISDDMIPQKFGFDEIIRLDMVEFYCNSDGCLWYNDFFTQDRLCTLSIMGYNYYKRFNYIYHHDYTSLWADNEYTEVAKRLNKITYLEDCIIRHEHPAWNSSIKADGLYNKNEAYYKIDEEVYRQRLIKNFDL